MLSKEMETSITVQEEDVLEWGGGAVSSSDTKHSKEEEDDAKGHLPFSRHIETIPPVKVSFLRWVLFRNVCV